MPDELVLGNVRTGKILIEVDLDDQGNTNCLPADNPLPRPETREELEVVLGEVLHHSPNEGLICRIHQAHHQERVALREGGLIDTTWALGDEHYADTKLPALGQKAANRRA